MSNKFSKIGFSMILYIKLVAISLALLFSVAYYKRREITDYLVKNHWIHLKFKESKLAHQLLDGLRGIEIGASAQNPFGLNTLNVDYSDDYTSIFKEEERDKTNGEYV